MKYNIPLFIFSLIIITGCSDEEENLSNTFHSTHAGSVWVTTNNYWFRINEDSEDDYWDNKCTRYPYGDGTYNSKVQLFYLLSDIVFLKNHLEPSYSLPAPSNRLNPFLLE